MAPEVLLDRFEPQRRATAERLRALVRDAVPGVVERVRPGWGLIGYHVAVGPRRTAYFAFVWPEAEHVHLGFEYGIYMHDPGRRLQGSGRKIRWLTFADPDAIEAEPVAELLREAARVAALTPGQRVARLIDRPD